MTTALREQRNQERKERTRTALLMAAQRVFVEKGYHAALISDIVATAGLGQGTFYRHFESKPQLFDALIDTFLDDLLDEFAEMSEKLPTNVEEYRTASIEALVSAAKIVDSNRRLFQLILREGPAIDRTFEEKIEGMYGAFAELAGFYLEHAIANDFARDCDTAVVAEAIIGAGKRILDAWWAGRFEGMTMRRVIEETVAFAFEGFGLKEAL